MTEPVCSFVHISDTHIGATDSFELYRKNTRAYAERAVAMINSLESSVDFVAHTGDVLAQPSPECLEQAREVLGRVKYPFYTVTGNHDSPSTTKEFLNPDLTFLPNAGCSYIVDRPGLRCVFLDTRGPDEIDPHGLFDSDREKALAAALQGYHGKVLVFTHFPALPIDSVWHDRDMLLLDGDRLHSLLKDADVDIAGVFFGHLHRHVTVVRDGIPYISAGSSFCRFGALPSDTTTRFEYDAPGVCNYVTVTQQAVIVKELEIPGV